MFSLRDYLIYWICFLFFYFIQKFKVDNNKDKVKSHTQHTWNFVPIWWTLINPLIKNRFYSLPRMDVFHNTRLRLFHLIVLNIQANNTIITYVYICSIDTCFDYFKLDLVKEIHSFFPFKCNITFLKKFSFK